MTLMEFVINLAVNGNEAARDLARVAGQADNTGDRMAALETRASLAGQRIGAGMKSAVIGIAAVGAAAAAAGVGLIKLANSVAAEIDEMGDFADLNNIGIEALQELGYAAQKTGSDKEALKSSISGLNKVMGESITGVGRGAKMLDKFGLSAKNTDGSIKTVDQMMGDISEKMQGLSRQEAIAMASKLGIDKGLVPLLQAGKTAIDGYRNTARELGVTTEEQAAKTAEYTSQMEDMNQTFGYLKNLVGSEVAPVISGRIKQFLESQGGVAGLKVKVQEFAQKLAVVLPQIAKVAAAFATVVIAGAKLMDWLAQGVGGWDNFAYALVGVKTLAASGLLAPLIQGFIRLGAVMLANPIGIVVAAIVAGAYLVWTNWDRIIGFLKAAWQGAKDSLMGVVNGIKQYWDDLKNSVINNVNEIIDAANRLPFVDIGHIGGVAGGAGSTASPVTSQGAGASSSFTNNVTVNATTPQAVDRAVSPNFARQTATAGYGGVFA